MQPRLDSEHRVLTLVFRDAEAARAYLAEVRSTGGLQVTLERKLAQYDVFDLTVELGGDEHRAFRAYVARVAEDGGGSFTTALVLQEWDEASERELLRRLGTSDISSDPAEPSEQDAEEPVEPAAPVEGETRGVAAVHGIRQMNPGQKTILAQRAGRSERQVLLRDNSPQVLQGLLVNPRIEAKEILRIAKSTYTTGAILQRIAGDARWGKNQEIIAAVVRNPKSPTLMAARLVEKLRTSDLRPMAKMSSGLKEGLRKAALREYLKRTGRK